MEPEMRLREKECEAAGIQKGIQQGVRQRIQDVVDMLREFDHKDEEIKLTLMDKYNLSAEEVEEYFL